MVWDSSNHRIKLSFPKTLDFELKIMVWNSSNHRIKLLFSKTIDFLFKIGFK
jgi:hypothetical protein